MINGIESPSNPEKDFLSLPFTISASLRCRLYQEEESLESSPICESSLQLSKSSASQDLHQGKSKLLSPRGFKDVEASVVNSMKTLSEMSFEQSFKDNEIPVETWRMSEAITSAKESFYEVDKEGNGKFSIHYTSFAVPSRIFCNTCEKDVFTIVLTQLIQPNFWDNFENFFNTIICCENKGESKGKELIHCCSHCHKILARISAGN